MDATCSIGTELVALRNSVDTLVGSDIDPVRLAIVRAGEPIAVANPGTEPAELVVAITAGFTAMTADGTPIGTPAWAA